MLFLFSFNKKVQILGNCIKTILYTLITARKQFIKKRRFIMQNNYNYDNNQNQYNNQYYQNQQYPQYQQAYENVYNPRAELAEARKKLRSLLIRFFSVFTVSCGFDMYLMFGKMGGSETTFYQDCVASGQSVAMTIFVLILASVWLSTFLSCIREGKQLLAELFPDSYVYVPFLLWGIYFIIKLGIYGTLSLYIFPITLVKTIIKIHKLKKEVAQLSE